MHFIGKIYSIFDVHSETLNLEEFGIWQECGNCIYRLRSSIPQLERKVLFKLKKIKSTGISYRKSEANTQ